MPLFATRKNTGILRSEMQRNWIKKKSAPSLHPIQVENGLVQLANVWPADAIPLAELIENFPLGESAVLHLLAMSRICAARLAREPQLLLWLAQPEICDAPRGYAEMLIDLRRSSTGSIAENNFRALRAWRNREMTRIALRELSDAAPLDETAAELSQLAEICVAQVYDHWRKRLVETLGAPKADFAIIALGKLGGRELNHSSDIDVLFVYGEEGQVSSRVSHHEWFNRLGEKIVTTFSTADPEGPLFRIDLRLRPEGSSGPLARSLESMENYYAGFGETWERLALIKARGIAGSRELAYEFLRQHQPFVYPRSPSRDVLDDIASIKRRIERELAGEQAVERNVKLGRGGIREIEFVVQTLQFLHGARNTFLQESSTLKALPALSDLELIPRKSVLDLDRAYRFLRRTEHRLQIDTEQQTHTVPRDTEFRARFGASLGFASGDEFTAALRQTMRTVHSIFETVVRTSPTDAVSLDLTIFRDEKAATRALNDLTKRSPHSHVAPRSQQLFRKLQPLLLAQLAETSDPDAVLNQFVRFAEAYGLRGLLFELLVTNPKLLELLVKTLDVSRFAGGLLTRRPQLLEDITRRDESFYRPRTVAEHLRRLEQLGASASNLDPIRAYRQRQVLRIILRDVLGPTESVKLFAELTDLAEACLLFVNQLIGGADLTIVALGKFGGREINYGADLDVLFVGEDVRAAQNLIVTLAQSSAEGNIANLDARLRPDGEKGPLVSSLAAYESYYGQRAQLWELQALTRARPITGPLQEEYCVIARKIWSAAGKRPDLFGKIDNMVERVRNERGTGSEFADFKTGSGGMVEAEFAIQALQMKNSIWQPNWNEGVAELVRQNLVPAGEAEPLTRSYNFLRSCETSLRRWQNSKIDILPVAEEEQRMLSRRLGYETVASFKSEYLAAREAIHQFYERRVRALVT
jgi:glutamate-ammonia-ligase adenylyltransferase